MSSTALPPPLQSWPLAALVQAAAAAGLPDLQAEATATIDSTNAELMRRVGAGLRHALLLVAERQSAGRGRLGRVWHSQQQPGSLNSLTFSLGLPLLRSDWSGLSLAVGLALAQSLHPAIGLKWPNDLWLQQRKLGGILIETTSLGRLRYAVIGIGLNLAAPPTDGLTTAPAWLRELLPEITAAQALQRLLPTLSRSLRQFESAGFAPFQADFAACDVLQDQAIMISDGRSGVARGVAADGALLLDDGSALQRVISAEVSVRPLAPGRPPA